MRKHVFVGLQYFLCGCRVCSCGPRKWTQQLLKFERVWISMYRSTQSNTWRVIWGTKPVESVCVEQAEVEYPWKSNLLIWGHLTTQPPVQVSTIFIFLVSSHVQDLDTCLHCALTNLQYKVALQLLTSPSIKVTLVNKVTSFLDVTPMSISIHIGCNKYQSTCSYCVWRFKSSATHLHIAVSDVHVCSDHWSQVKLRVAELAWRLSVPWFMCVWPHAK